MKKTFLLLTAAATLAVSCTNAQLQSRIDALENRQELKNLVDTFSVLADVKDTDTQDGEGVHQVLEFLPVLDGVDTALKLSIGAGDGQGGGGCEEEKGLFHIALICFKLRFYKLTLGNVCEQSFLSLNRLFLLQR